MDKLIENGEINQIVVITDGSFNSKINPIEAAKKVFESGIAVSTIGIVDPNSRNNENDIEEVKKIANAGGGLCEYSNIENLGRTIQHITNKTARRIIEQVVSRQLKTIMGQEIDDLEPESRLKIADFIEKYGENINLKCVVVLDTGKRMRDKLSVIKRSVVELLENLQKRKGSSSISVITYQREDADMCRIICSFTSEISILRQSVELISSNGSMLTGSAILKACELMYRYYEVCGDGIPG